MLAAHQTTQGPTTTTLHARPIEIVTQDGFLLGARLFEPRGPALGAVVIHGATAVKQTYYAPFAAYLAERGMRVLTYDYRGVGASRPGSLRGLSATMTDWAALDARAAHAHALSLSDANLAFVGHSFGGQIVGLVDDLKEAKGAVLVGSQLGYVGHWPNAMDRARIALAFKALVPALTSVLGYWPGSMGLGTDLPAGVAREWARWCTHPDYLMSEHPDATARFSRFDKPLLVYSFTDDDFAPEPAVGRLMDLLPSASVTHLRVAPRDIDRRSIGHFGFFRAALREALWGGAGRFLAALLTGKPLVVDKPQSPWSSLEQELLADLRYGRS